MRYLADTQIVLWYAIDDRRLAPALPALEADDATVFVSIASLWETAIKLQIGKLQAPDDLPDRIAAEFGFEMLAVEADHVWTVRQLPRHHGDPFDRLLIAQAKSEGLTVVTADDQFSAYDVEVVAV